MKNNNNLFWRLSVLVLASTCLMITGCQQNNGGGGNNQESSLIPPEPEYNIVRPEFTPDYDTFGVSEMPSGVNMSFYSDMYSRGFSWLTNKDVEGTELYLVQSDKGKDADFTDAECILGNSLLVTCAKDGTVSAEGLTAKKGSSNTQEEIIMSHKVHVENLEKGKAYSYKIGSEAGYVYGAFIVEKEQAKSITAVHMSDAQTKNLSKTNVWRNTFVKSVETAGKGLDFALYNGDQFDQNNASGNDKEPMRLFRYANALDVIYDYKFDIPYMSSSGNHEPASAYSHYFMSGDIKYGDFDYTGAYYSYDYDFAHFVVLNSNDVSTEQINWLENDLEAAKDAEWKVVMMHISPYTTGDHSNKSANQNIVQKLTPIFSSKHVDLVLQAHDHTYNKTKAYRWDATGYTETYDNDEVVNLNPEKETLEDVIYDKNPNGTYYVTTGAAGHRAGAEEADGIWAEVNYDADGNAAGLDSSKTFLTNKYKIELGTLTQTNQYEPCSWNGKSCDQTYNAGELATGNVNAQMFGVLNLTENTLAYHVYTVNGETVKLFDTLDVLKA